MELTTVEVFDPHFNTWKPQTSMTMVRSVRSQERHVQTEKGHDTQQQNPPQPLVSAAGSGWTRALYVGVGGITSWSTSSPKLLPFQPLL